ncbi:hypothetical protein NYR60_05305 [Actinobacillus genomosp. 2]|uniref:hypothetical protein n=1 Tax=Actinobacillus TaxID=713 RepID=UPI002418AC75|nr:MULTISPECIES: hypothetical protein [Actinobacillus]MDG4953589.1 hypothetical protein [Actinobacillus equuli subsp. equuli]WGE31290.1 hypothetical protein NYR60_05305 [Actinobacillus genomosp. 2]
MNEKDRFHFNILKRMALGDNNAFDKIALIFDFDGQQIDTLCDVFEEFEQRDFTYGELEKRLSETLRLNYQDLKTIIHCLYDDHRYVDVIGTYLRSNKKIVGNLSLEYISIARELGI